MKILSDSIRCNVFRMANGLPWALPKLAAKLPREKLPSRWRPFVMPVLLVGVSVLVFKEPRVLPVLVPISLAFAWFIGKCPHCVALKTAPEDCSDHRDDDLISVQKES